MKINVVKLFDAAAANPGFLAPALVVLAMVALGLAASGVREAVREAASRLSQGDEPVAINLVNAPVAAARMRVMAGKLMALAPAVSVVVSGDSMVLSVPTTDRYPEFMASLSTVLGLADDVRWEARSICFNSCQSGIAAQARIAAFTQSIQTSR